MSVVMDFFFVGDRCPTVSNTVGWLVSVLWISSLLVIVVPLSATLLDVWCRSLWISSLLVIVVPLSATLLLPVEDFMLITLNYVLGELTYHGDRVSAGGGCEAAVTA